MTKNEWKRLQEFTKLFSASKTIILPFNDCQKYKSIIELMMQEKLFMKHSYDNQISYTLVGDLNIFVENLKEQDKKAKTISKREWKIAIISAIIGAIIGLIPTIINFIGGIKNAGL